MKGDLNTRPIFVRTPEHIHAHLLICMISLIILRLIQNKIVDHQNIQTNLENKYWKMGLSGERIQKALNDWTIDKFPGELYRFNNIDTPDLKLILDSFNIKIQPKLYRKADLKHIKQTIDLS